MQLPSLGKITRIRREHGIGIRTKYDTKYVQNVSSPLLFISYSLFTSIMPLFSIIVPLHRLHKLSFNNFCNNERKLSKFCIRLLKTIHHPQIFSFCFNSKYLLTVQSYKKELENHLWPCIFCSLVGIFLTFYERWVENRGSWSDVLWN